MEIILLTGTEWSPLRMLARVKTSCRCWWAHFLMDHFFAQLQQVHRSWAFADAHVVEEQYNSNFPAAMFYEQTCVHVCGRSNVSPIFVTLPSEKKISKLLKYWVLTWVYFLNQPCFHQAISGNSETENSHWQLNLESVVDKSVIRTAINNIWNLVHALNYVRGGVYSSR